MSETPVALCATPFLAGDFCAADFGRLRDFLLARRGFDLGHYKDRCIKRRIAARIRKLGCAGPDDYLARLRDDTGEVDALLAALSIHVSQFFRNPATFRVLERQILPQLVENARRQGRREVRLWSAGCAGGEEPYSLALLLEDLLPVDLTATIEATDVSPAVLERARQGLYEAQRLAEVPPPVLERYFQGEGASYRLREEIRRQVRFAPLDLLAAAPYPRADLILCRNVLIYFSRQEQEQVLRRFATALLPGGALVLGRAETLCGDSRSLFHVEFPAERIYRLADSDGE